MFGTLTTEQIDQLLGQQVLGRLGCHAQGLTYVVPISYAYRDGYIYCYTMEGLKMSMLRTSGKVCFQVDNTKDLANWQSVICWGEFEELKDEAGKKKALEILNARNFPMITSQKMQINPEWPFGNGIEKLKGIFFRIKVEDRTGRYEVVETREQYTS